MASQTDDDLKYPEECSNDDDEDGMGTGVLLFSKCFSHYYDVSLVGSVVECCSEVDKPQLVVTGK